MKVFITVDMEGIAGLVRWDWSGAERQRERELMTAEANAAIAGAFAGGATEVLVSDSHGAHLLNLIPESIDRRARFLSGEPRPLCHMVGLDESFDLVLMLGCHARAGASHAVMCHSFSFNVHRLRFNGVDLGEIAVDSALAGEFGVPVGLVTGDQAACDEALEILGEREYLPVKKGFGRYVADCLPPAVAHEQVQAAATRAVSRAGSFAPFTVTGPVTVEMEFALVECADKVEPLPHIERTSGREICFTETDFPAAFETMIGLIYLTDHA